MSIEGKDVELTKEDYIAYLKYKRGTLNAIEIFIVLMVFIFIFGFGLLDSTYRFLFSGGSDTINKMPTGIQVIFATSLDVIYTVIYGISPIQQMILKITGYGEKVDKKEVSDRGRTAPTSEPDAAMQTKEEKLESYLKNLIDGSERLSNTILARGSLYLFLGIVFSLCGLAFFYMQAHTLNPQDDITRQIISLLPNFGVLFFIELISFFFLKQYRVTMDEFRYYEAIKRSREEILTMVKLYLSVGRESDLVNILDRISLSSQIGKLDSGQSTELLETRKLDKGELDSLTRIIEAAIGKLGSGK